MKIAAQEYINSHTYHRPEVVKQVSRWISQMRLEHGADSYQYKLAHRISSLVWKRYRRNLSPVLRPLCEEWEQDPGVFYEWLMSQPAGRLYVTRGAFEVSPATARIIPYDKI